MRKLILGIILTLAIFAGSAAAETADMQKPAEKPFKFDTRLAIGAGIPFGGLGANIEAMFDKYLSASIGLGVMDGELGWAGGLRVYPMGRDMTVSPRLSAYYGTVATLDWGYRTDLDVGAAYGVGLEWRTSPKMSVDFDVLYIDYEEPGGFIRTESSDFVYTIGYGWYF